MPRRRLPLWVASLAAVHTAATAIPLDDLFTRQSTCAAPNFRQCNNDDFPDFFCCPPNQNCIALAGNTTLLCCPRDSDCVRIEPLPCDISLQDGEKYPDAVVKTTALGGTLTRCDGQCCPFGYSCVSDKCVRDRNQNAVPIQTSKSLPAPTATSGVKPSATGDATPSPTADTTSPADNPSESATDAGEESDSSSGPPVAAIAGGVTAALVVLIGAAVFAFFFLRKRNGTDKSGNQSKPSSRSSSFGNISHPFPQSDTGRTDFTRGSPPRDALHEPDSVTGALIDSSVNSPEAGAGAGLTVPPIAAQMAKRQSGGYDGYNGYGGGGGGGGYGNGYGGGYGGLAPQTPRDHREPSSVSINVFADPNITPDRTPESRAGAGAGAGGGNNRRYSNVTTFTQMLDTADLGGVARGESYVAYHPGAMPRR